MAEQRERKAALIAELGNRRENLDLRRRGLARVKIVKAKAEESIREHPTAWFVGSLVAAGLISASLKGALPGQNPRKKRHGVRALLLSGAVALAKPKIKSWLIEQGKKELQKQIYARRQQSTLGHSENL
ncbi:MAG: hypothetical protein ACQKBY_02495 [Verrucomicrobiales bacterium]